jgi:hypothetical protein
VPFDDDEFTPTELHDPTRADDPCAEAIADRTIELVTQVASLKALLEAAKAELRAERLKRAQLALELNRLRNKK